MPLLQSAILGYGTYIIMEDDTLYPYCCYCGNERATPYPYVSIRINSVDIRHSQTLSDLLISLMARPCNRFLPVAEYSHPAGASQKTTLIASKPRGLTLDSDSLRTFGNKAHTYREPASNLGAISLLGSELCAAIQQSSSPVRLVRIMPARI